MISRRTLFGFALAPLGDVPVTEALKSPMIGSEPRVEGFMHISDIHAGGLYNGDTVARVVRGMLEFQRDGGKVLIDGQ